MSDYSDPDAYQGAVKSAIADAVDYIDTVIAPQRAKSTKYYNAEPFGNEEEGRSQIVMSVVRDKVLAMLPSVLRVFTSSDEMVEYTANTEEKVPQAQQATDYANHIIWKDNPGFLVIHSWLKDGLVRKLGVVKMRWTEKDEVTESDFSGLSPEEVAVLEQTEGVEVLEKIEAMAEGIVTFDMRIRRTVKSGRVVIECLPPEEFYIARDARDVGTASLVGHRSRPTISDLVAMGYDQEEIEEHMGGDMSMSGNIEAAARNPYVDSFGSGAGLDSVMRQVDYFESYIRIDKDGDGIAELRKVCTLGAGHYVLHDEIADDVPFALFCPDPEPHMIFGQSITDQVGDLQLITSNIMRNTLDSLAQSIHPRMYVLEGAVNIDDVLNTEVGGVIRGRQIGAVTPITTPFVGQAALPMLAYMDEIGARRTGVMPATQGLDPEALQSTDKDAVRATIQGAQERIEMVCRFFAEMGMKQLFRGILKLICKHQDQPRIIRMRGNFVPIDPRAWDADLDVQINVALGRGTDQDRLQSLMLILQKQEQIIQLLGPDNPISGVEEYSNALSQSVALMGFKDASRYFKRTTVQALQQFMQQKPPQAPDPNLMLVQIEQMKAQAKAQNDQAELALKAHEVELTDRRERENNHMDFLAKIADIEAKYKTNVDIASLEAEIEARTRQQEASVAAETDRHANLTDMAAQMHATMNPPPPAVTQ